MAYLAWLKTLAETYDTYADLAGVNKNDQAVLLPISHSTFNAQIEVMINLSGDFEENFNPKLDAFFIFGILHKRLSLPPP